MSESWMIRIRKSIATQDSCVIVIAPERIDIYPDTRLAYYPFSPPLREAPPDLFAAAEDDEYRLRDFAAAIEKLRRLDVGPDDAVRAGAELRLARNLRRSGQLRAALDVYGRPGAARRGWTVRPSRGSGGTTCRAHSDSRRHARYHHLHWFEDLDSERAFWKHRDGLGRHTDPANPIPVGP